MYIKFRFNCPEWNIYLNFVKFENTIMHTIVEREWEGETNFTLRRRYVAKDVLDILNFRVNWFD